LFAQTAFAAPIWSFDTIPSGGAISGAPGQTVGWGYTITNSDLTDWLVITALDAPPFLSADPNPVGIFDFPIVPPNTTVNVPYVPGTAGLYEVTVKTAPPVTFEAGLFTLTADWFDGDPSLDSDIVFSEDSRQASFSLTVSSAPPPSIPEPPTWLLLVAGLVFLGSRVPIHPHRRNPMKARLAVLFLAAGVLPLLLVGHATAGGGFSPPPFPNGIKVTGPAIDATIVMDAHDGLSFPNRDGGFTPAQASIQLERKEKRAGAVFTIPDPTIFFDVFGCDASRTKTRFITTSTSWVPLNTWIPQAVINQIFADLGVTVSGSLIPIITHVDDAICTADPTNPGPPLSGTPLPGTLSFDATIQFAVPRP